MALQRVTLPDALGVWAPSAFEAAVLYREIVAERTYERHGVALHDGAVVFDIGANIGLFSVHLARTVRDVALHAFEPLPANFEALTRNLSEHAPSARAYNVVLADRAGDAMFELDRFATMAATMHPDVFDRGAKPGVRAAAWASAGLADLARVTPRARWLRALRAGLRVPVLRFATLAMLAPFALAIRVRRWLFLDRVRCRLITLSAALAESGAGHVDLVKIDVEGAEEQVLNGIDERDWPKLRQFVIEVHDIEGRLARLTRLFEARGYRAVAAREDWALHELLGIATLYAIREERDR